MKTCLSVLLLSAALAAGSLPAQAQDASPQQSPPPMAQPLSAADVVSAAQQFVNLLSTEDYAAARQMYDLTTNSTVTPGTLQANWEDIINQLGAFQSVADTRTLPLENPEGGTMAIVTVQFENGSRDLYIVYSSTYRVVSFDTVQAQ
jgi:hypothetical protein